MAATGRKPFKRLRSILIYTSYLLIVLLIAGEVTVRIMGYQAWQPAEQSFAVEPEGPFFRPDSLLGYAGRPGRFEVTLDGQLQFSVRHNALGYRVTSATEPNGTDTLYRPEIWVFGCSFTHGYGVNDEDTWPWRLQERLPDHQIRNFGMDGYGTLHSWLQLREELARRPAPALVILAYGAFHDQRNTSNRYWRKVLHGREVVEGLRYPHVRFGEGDSLVMGDTRLEYAPFPLMRYSALSHYLEMGWNRMQDRRLRSEEVTRILINRVVETCNDLEVSFLLAGIYRESGTKRMLDQFAREGVRTLDVSQDLEADKMRILPSDGHPSALAHGMIAQKLADYLDGSGLLSGQD